MWASQVRGTDRPDLCMADNDFWEAYMASLQAQQLFTNTNDGDAGFMSVKYMDADVVLDGGVYNPAGGGAPAGTAYFLNCD